MYGKANKLDNLLTTNMMCEKEENPQSLDSKCMTRMMTHEDWEKYGPVNTSDLKKAKNSKAIFLS